MASCFLPSTAQILAETRPSIHDVRLADDQETLETFPLPPETTKMNFEKMLYRLTSFQNRAQLQWAIAFNLLTPTRLKTYLFFLPLKID